MNSNKREKLSTLTSTAMSHEDHLYHRGIQATPDSNLDLKSQPDVLTDAKRRLGLTVSINRLGACDVCAVYTDYKMI